MSPEPASRRATRKFLESVGIATQANLAAARSLGFPHNEETVTENLILWTHRSGLPSVEVHALTKPQEAKYGYDYDLRLETQPSVFKSIVIQAKREGANGAYRVEHKVAGTTQLLLLEGHASATGSMAAYAFYNASVRTGFVNSHCPCTAACGAAVSADDSLIGCTVTPLADVKWVLQQFGACRLRNIHDLSQTVPLRCLMCPRGLGTAQADEVSREPQGPIPWQNQLEGVRSDVRPEAVVERLSIGSGWRDDYPTGFIPKYMVVIRTST